MNNRDLFTDFTNGVFDARIKACINESLSKNGLFGYVRFRELENIYASNFPAEAYRPEMDIAEEETRGQYKSSTALLNRYLAFINTPLSIQRLAHIISVVNRRTTTLDHSVLERDVTPISTWDVASNDVINAGKEARLLLLHKVVNLTTDDYMFQMISDEYLRAVINKFECKEFSAEAVDIIGRIVGDSRDTHFIIMLIFAVFAFTCVKTYGAPTSNSKLIAEVALQLCGTGIVYMDYYFRRIYDEFINTDLTINFNLLSSIYSADLELVARQEQTIHNLRRTAGQRNKFSSLLRNYLKAESSYEYDIDDKYFDAFTAWKEHGVIQKGDVRSSIKYIRALTTDTNRISAGVKTVLDNEVGILPNYMVIVLKAILEASPDLDTTLNLRRLALFRRQDRLITESKVTSYDKVPSYMDWAPGMFPDTVGDILQDFMSSSVYTEIPAWKHCLFILTYMRYGCGLPMTIRVSHLTDDIRDTINTYYNLYRGIEVGTAYKFMLSP